MIFLSPISLSSVIPLGYIVVICPGSCWCLISYLVFFCTFCLCRLVYIQIKKVGWKSTVDASSSDRQRSSPAGGGSPLRLRASPPLPLSEAFQNPQQEIQLTRREYL